MMSFLRRILPGLFGRTSPRPQADARRSGAAAPDRDAPAAGAAPVEPASALSALVNVGARRPLIAPAGDVVGFEFRLGDDVLRRLSERPDVRGRSAHVSALLASARLITQTGRVGFARLPVDWLEHAQGLDPGAGTLVGIEQATDTGPGPKDRAPAVQALQRLRAAGAKIGWDVSQAPLGQPASGLKPDFLLVRQGAQPITALLAALKTLPAELKTLPILVTDIASAEDLEEALYGGIHYACGAFAQDPVAESVQTPLPVPPQVRAVGRLLNQLVAGAETAEIVHGIKHDVALSYRLLQRMGSAELAQLNAGASIEQAVMMLGRNELYRWLSVQLLQYAGARKTSPALQEVTLWRARLLELLAVDRGVPAPGELFTLGLASMMGVIMTMSVADVVDTLSLPEPARQALLEHGGPWFEYLQLLSLVQAHAIDDPSGLVDSFGGAARVGELSDQAWAWAAVNTQPRTGPAA